MQFTQDEINRLFLCLYALGSNEEVGHHSDKFDTIALKVESQFRYEDEPYATESDLKAHVELLEKLARLAK